MGSVHHVDSPQVKHRKQHHPKQRGVASGGTSVTFGDYGIQALEHAYITNRQSSPHVSPSTAISSVVARCGSTSSRTVR